jgi:hypothetical protein
MKLKVVQKKWPRTNLLSTTEKLIYLLLINLVLNAEWVHKLKK